MSKRRYLVALVGTTAAVAIGAGAAGAASGSKAAPTRSAAPRSQTARHSGNCPNMGSTHAA
jgi:hypothetical protein